MSAAERRAQILAVTKGLADAEGFHAISLERVAREAGITRPIVYQHFGDLDGLLTALVETEGEAALAQLAEILPAGPARGGPGRGAARQRSAATSRLSRPSRRAGDSS